VAIPFQTYAPAAAVDHRKLVLIALLPQPRLWLLFVIGAVMAGLDGLQRPPLDALLPRFWRYRAPD
jgi:hypothetical protein